VTSAEFELQKKRYDREFDVAKAIYLAAMQAEFVAKSAYAAASLYALFLGLTVVAVWIGRSAWHRERCLFGRRVKDERREALLARTRRVNSSRR
jgi:hypothetical protein